MFEGSQSSYFFKNNNHNIQIILSSASSGIDKLATRDITLLDVVTVLEHESIMMTHNKSMLIFLHGASVLTN